MAKMTKLIKVSKIWDFKWGDCQWYTFRRSEPHTPLHIHVCTKKERERDLVVTCVKFARHGHPVCQLLHLRFEDEQRVIKLVDVRWCDYLYTTASWTSLLGPGCFTKRSRIVYKKTKSCLSTQETDSTRVGKRAHSFVLAYAVSE